MKTQVQTWATTRDAYRLIHEGVLAFGRAEQAGIRVDVDYCEKARAHLTRKAKHIENQFMETDLAEKWREVYGAKMNIKSGPQLSHILYDVIKLKPPKRTQSGEYGATDEEALRRLEPDVPEIASILDIRQLLRLRDPYLGAFLREQVNGYIHPFINLHVVKTYRSCVAKGSKVLVLRNFENNPDGMPIEEVRKGDFVYCFDDDLNPAIRRVLWAGKTGHCRVLRVHWKGAKGNRGFLDVTPEHKIRHIGGKYIEAQSLVGDLRTENESKRAPKIRVLSCNRRGDELNFTGHSRSPGCGLLEHRFIYEKLVGPLKEHEVVHHINGNHLDHRIENLKKKTIEAHSSYHSKNAPKEVKEKRIKSLHANRHKIKYKYGKEHPNSLSLTKYKCLRQLAESKGRPTFVPYDTSTFNKYCKEHEIDVKSVRLRYDGMNRYISRGRLKRLSIGGRNNVKKELKISFYKVLKLYELYGLDTKRRWGNQFGEFSINNHVITNIEWIDKYTDVYDLEVEEYNNFFANEICVHNSIDKPSMQNIPKRDKESRRITRKAIYPRPGHQLLGIDFSGIEVRVAQCYNHDPVMLKYILTPGSDMHLDMAKQIFLLEFMSKGISEHNVLRDAAKNGFVFAQFYGDYWGNCAEYLACEWGKLPRSGQWHPNQGISMPTGTLSDHLIGMGIDSYEKFEKHVADVEEDFWGNRFKVYQQWKDDFWQEYQQQGYLDMYTGFRCSGVMAKNRVINAPIQGSAFHCLLWSFIEIDKIQRTENWKSRLVWQIHDEIIIDVHPSELEHVANTVLRVTCEALPKAWDWITVPLEVDATLSPVDASWADGEDYALAA